MFGCFTILELISKFNQHNYQTIGFVQIERYTTHVLEQESNRKEEDVCHLSPEEFTFAKEWVLLTCWKTLFCNIILFGLVQRSQPLVYHITFESTNQEQKNTKIDNYLTNIQSTAYGCIVYFIVYRYLSKSFS